MMGALRFFVVRWRYCHFSCNPWLSAEPKLRGRPFPLISQADFGNLGQLDKQTSIEFPSLKAVLSEVQLRMILLCATIKE